MVFIFTSNNSKRIVKEILKAAGRCGQYEIFGNIVDDCINKYKIPLFKEFYEVQIHHYARSGDLVSAENAYEDLLQSKLKPDQYTYILMTYVYALVQNNI